MTAHGTDHYLDVKEFSTRIQEELIQSKSEGSFLNIVHMILRKTFGAKFEDLSVFQFIPGARQYFVMHNFLKKADNLLLMSTAFDFMLGFGYGMMPYEIYNRLETILFIPLLITVTVILGLNGFVYEFWNFGILNKVLQIVMMIFFLFTDLSRQTSISYDSSLLCITETCVKCQLPFSQPLLSSSKICICVCQNCHRKSDECTKCQTSPFTGTQFYYTLYSTVGISKNLGAFEFYSPIS